MAENPRLSLQSCDLQYGRWEARVRLPDYDPDVPSPDLSAGTYSSSQGHGLLITASDPRDLRAIGMLLISAAECADA